MEEVLQESHCGFFSWNGWTAVAAIASVIYTGLTYLLLRSAKKSLDIANKQTVKANKLAEFQIYMKITEQLFTNEAFQLLEMISDDNFTIVQVKGTELVDGKQEITEAELRRYILNPLEDLAKFHEDGLVTIESIDSGFGNVVLQIGGSPQIVNYIVTARFKDPGIYEGIEKLFEKEKAMQKDPSRFPNYFRIDK